LPRRGGARGAELRDLAQDYRCARDSGRSLVEELVNVVSWFDAIALGLSHEGGRSFDPSSWKSPDM
jgi:hypothetical protein